jgi:hypothetical protein
LFAGPFHFTNKTATYELVKSARTPRSELIALRDKRRGIRKANYHIQTGDQPECAEQRKSP